MLARDAGRAEGSYTHGMRPRIAPCLAALIAVALATTGCDSMPGPTGTEFGAHYRIELEPDPPTLNATALAVTVSHGGCRGGHEFRVQQRLVGSMLELWVVKVTEDEPCDMLVVQRVTLDAPAASGALQVVLRGPNIDPYRLR
jgi:hypothetical protein